MASTKIDLLKSINLDTRLTLSSVIQHALVEQFRYRHVVGI
jgi:hypothetical protein